MDVQPVDHDAGQLHERGVDHHDVDPDEQLAQFLVTRGCHDDRKKKAPHRAAAPSAGEGEVEEPVGGAPPQPAATARKKDPRENGVGAQQASLVYRELWAAIIVANIEEACGRRDACRRGGRNEHGVTGKHADGCECWRRSDAVRWLAGNYWLNGFTFEQLCDGLGVGARSIRNRLWRPDRLLGDWWPTLFGQSELRQLPEDRIGVLQSLLNVPLGVREHWFYSEPIESRIETWKRRPVREVTSRSELLAICLRAWARGEKAAMPGAVKDPKFFQRRHPATNFGNHPYAWRSTARVTVSPRPPA